MPSRRNREVLYLNGPVAEVLATRVPVFLDTAGLFFVEASRRVERGARGLARILPELKAHTSRVATARRSATADDDSAWVEVIRELGRVETDFGATVNHFLIADVFLVAAAEAYINSVAAFVLPRGDFEHFDKLNPVGKWLFLPKIMKLKWKPSLSKGCLQQFAALVARRNRIVHAKQFKVGSAAQAEDFVRELRLEEPLARAGVKAVRELLRQFSLSWKGSYGPDWLDPKRSSMRPPCLLVGFPDAPVRYGRARRQRTPKKPKREHAGLTKALQPTRAVKPNGQRERARSGPRG
jgi:hypothetical protein